MQPVFRFAPSPNGYLHLGHAYSALLNAQLAKDMGGRFLIRVEDIDTTRCRRELIDAALEDLAWLGLAWEQPVLRQSGHFERYKAVLVDLEESGLVFRCYCMRKALADCQRNTATCPDGMPLYSGKCRNLSPTERATMQSDARPYSMRLDMASAMLRIAGKPLFWQEWGLGAIKAQPGRWGDVILGRKEVPTSYHLSVVLDDALQGVTDIVRGKDLFSATAIHRLLQELLGLPEPRYRHHDLIRDEAGQKLAKSRISVPIRELRKEGISASDIRKRLGFE